MKIAIISNYRVGSESGVASVSETLIKHLSQNNEVLYVCLGSKYQYIRKKKLSYLKIPSSQIRQGYIPIITPKLTDMFYRNLDNFKPDVIHAQNIIFASVLSLIWAKKRNVPFIVTFHSMPSEGIVWLYPKFKKDKIISAIDFKLASGYVKRFLENTDHNIALNHYVKRSVLKVYKNAKATILRNGLDMEKFNNLKTTKLNNNKVVFTYLGSYMSKKNQLYLANVFSHLPKNYMLELFGNIKTGKAYVNKLRKTLKKNNTRNVRIKDFLNKNKVSKQLERTNYFVSASKKEAQSLVVIEALASGTPVIGLENETISELIDNKNGLKISKNTNPKTFASKLKLFVEKNEIHYLSTSQYCRESVGKFKIDIVSNKLIAIYKEIIKASKKTKIATKKRSLNLIPKKYRNLLSAKLPRRERRRAKHKHFLILSTMLTLLFWPVYKLINLKKRLNQ